MLCMLLDGMNHVAIITSDTERLHAFYRDVFDATVSHDMTEQEGVRLSFVDVGPHTELNVFEITGNTEAARQTPMFGRGRIDHLALQAASKDAFDTIRERLIERGSTDGFVTDSRQTRGGDRATSRYSEDLNSRSSRRGSDATQTRSTSPETGARGNSRSADFLDGSRSEGRASPRTRP